MPEMERRKINTWRTNLIVIAAFAIVGGLTWMVFRSDIGEFAQGVITLILGRFLGYLDAIYAFDFGTTRTNQLKDSTINELTNTAATTAKMAEDVAATAAAGPKTTTITTDNMNVAADNVNVADQNPRNPT